jgi:hypothetical protein
MRDAMNPVLLAYGIPIVILATLATGWAIRAATAPDRPARDLRRLLADAEADEFDAIIRAVTDDEGKAL